MPDDKNTLNGLRDVRKASGRKLGEEPKGETDGQLNDMDEDELREQLKQRGLEVRKVRRQKGVFARRDNVAGKLKITVHLPEQLRRDLKQSSLLTDKNESTIVEQALKLWMEHEGLGHG